MTPYQSGWYGYDWFITSIKSKKIHPNAINPHEPDTKEYQEWQRGFKDRESTIDKEDDDEVMGGNLS